MIIRTIEGPYFVEFPGENFIRDFNSELSRALKSQSIIIIPAQHNKTKNESDPLNGCDLWLNPNHVVSVLVSKVNSVSPDVPVALNAAIEVVHDEEYARAKQPLMETFKKANELANEKNRKALERKV